MNVKEIISIYYRNRTHHRKALRTRIQRFLGAFKK
jgi:hypothetical protein